MTQHSDQRAAETPAEQVAHLQAQLQALTEERDRALAARDAVVAQVLAPGLTDSSRAPRATGKLLGWAAGLALLAGVTWMMIHATRSGTQAIKRARRARTQQPSKAPAARAERPAPPPISRLRQTTLPVTELALLSCADLSSDGRLLALGGIEGYVQLFDLSRDRAVRSLKAHDGPVRALRFTPAGDALLSGGADGKVALWSLKGVSASRTLRESGAGVRALALCGPEVAVGGEQPAVELYPLRGGKPRRLVGHKSWVRAVACDADGAHLASAGHDGVVRLWDRRSGALQRKLQGHRLWVMTLAFSADGQLLASGGFDRKLRLWDVDSGRLRATLDGPVRWISDVALAPSGVLVAAASMDRTVTVWRVADGALRHRLRGHRHGVHTVRFTPDSAALISASTDGTVRTWPLPPPTPRAWVPLPPPGPGEVTLRRYTSGERMRVRLVDEAGKVLPEGRKRLAWILRSGPDDRQRAPHPKLVALLYTVAEHFGRQHEIWVISGYRSPEYNALRTRQSSQVGKNSPHMAAMAMDIRVDGVTITALRDFVQRQRAGGVGFYPDSNFVHMDVRRLRHWTGD